MEKNCDAPIGLSLQETQNAIQGLFTPTEIVDMIGCIALFIVEIRRRKEIDETGPKVMSLATCMAKIISGIPENMQKETLIFLESMKINLKIDFIDRTGSNPSTQMH